MLNSIIIEMEPQEHCLSFYRCIHLKERKNASKRAGGALPVVKSDCSVYLPSQTRRWLVGREREDAKMDGWMQEENSFLRT